MGWDVPRSRTLPSPAGAARPLARWLTAAGCALLALATALAFVLPAGAAAPDAQNQARLDLTIRFLQDVQNLDGGFGGRAGGASDPLFSAWVAIALAAGGVNPLDQAKPGGIDAYAYVTEHASELEYTTDFERAALVAVAAGAPLRDFGGVDLVAAILARQLPSGAFPYEEGGTTGSINTTAFAILPLGTLREPAVDAALARAVDWLLTVEAPSGGWGNAAGLPASSDVTAAVVQALHATGRTGTTEEAHAWERLRSLHNPDGGFGFDTANPESNAASTSWVVQAMWAAGVDPASYAPNRPSPLDYLASMQRSDGSIAWKAGDDSNSVWMTAYAAPAYGGHPLPVPAVPRAVDAPEPPPAAEAPAAAATPGAVDEAATRGQGGLGRARGGAVIAGGGGRGAPLFSRPQPQSQGQTAGGARDTSAAAADRPAKRSGRRAAEPRTAPRRGAGGGAGEPQVTGIVLGDAPAAAPGLRGAQAGGRAPGPALALGLTGALLLCAGLGAGVERRRPGALA